MEIPEINIPNIHIPEPIHIEPPIVLDTPVSIDMGVPVIDAPCAVVRDSLTGGKDHFNNDPDEMSLYAITPCHFILHLIIRLLQK